MNKDVRALKDACGKKNTRKRTSRKIITGVLKRILEIGNLSLNLCFKRFSVFEILDRINKSKSKVIYHMINSKLAKLGNNLNCLLSKF